MPGDECLRSRRAEWRLPREHLVQEARETVLIAPPVEVALRHRLLGTHVEGRTEGDPALSQLLLGTRRECSRNSEVGHNGMPVLEKNVLRLDVAMDQAAAVRVVECVGDLTGDADGLVDRQLMLAVHPRAKRLAFDEGHDVIEQAVDVPRVVKRQDVRMRQLGRDLDLPAEALGADGGGEIRMEDLDGDVATVFEVAREEDGGHATAAELALDRVDLAQGLPKAGQEGAHRRAGTDCIGQHLNI
jgi:hypothetical protein